MALLNRRRQTQGMGRPAKPRFINGIQLADNLYPDNKKRIGHYRYARPDSTFKHFTAPSVERANEIAAINNARRDNYTGTKKCPSRSAMSFYTPEYIAHRENGSADLKTKASWRNRCYALYKFANEMALPINKLDYQYVLRWWDALSHHQQKARHAEFRKFFNYLMGRGLLPKMESNPFTTMDDKPRLYTHSKPKRKRQRLTREVFWETYKKAGERGYEGLQIAMGVALTTFMREGDICTLKLSDHLEDDLLKRVISKSANQKSDAKAARLQWDVGNYKLLAQLIKRGRELALQNYACPYLVSHKPKQKRRGKTKTHVAQITPKRLQEMFAECIEATQIQKANLSTFHEIRSLADKLATDAGYEKKQIQHSMAVSSEHMVEHYLAGHELPYEKVEVIFTAEQIGGDFN